MEYERRFEKRYIDFLKEAVARYSGLFNAHLHLDRAGTLDPVYLEHVGKNPIEASKLTLKEKQNLTGELHTGQAYKKEDLKQRITYFLERMAEIGTKRADSFIDVSADCVGLTALETALEVKKELKEKIDFRVGAYNPFGFKDSEPERWELYKEAAKMADFLGTLPERDVLEGHIGFEEHFKRVLELAKELEKPIHLHVDQANNPEENGTETLIEAVKWLGGPESEDNEPMVWAVHVISPSTYREKRFKRMLNGLKEHNIGVICCPTAAISMRQPRHKTTPTYNSIARILDMIERKIPVRLGSDNIYDVFLPSTTESLYDEVIALSNILRIYDVDVLAKLMCYEEMNDTNRKVITNILEQDRELNKKGYIKEFYERLKETPRLEEMYTELIIKEAV